MFTSSEVIDDDVINWCAGEPLDGCVCGKVIYKLSKLDGNKFKIEEVENSNKLILKRKENTYLNKNKIYVVRIEYKSKSLIFFYRIIYIIKSNVESMLDYLLLKQKKINI